MGQWDALQFDASFHRSAQFVDAMSRTLASTRVVVLGILVLALVCVIVRFVKRGVQHKGHGSFGHHDGRPPCTIAPTPPPIMTYGVRRRDWYRTAETAMKGGLDSLLLKNVPRTGSAKRRGCNSSSKPRASNSHGQTSTWRRYDHEQLPSLRRRHQR